MVLRTARYFRPRSELNLGEISVFVGEDFVVSVRHGQASPLSGVREEAERRPDLLALGPSCGAARHRRPGRERLRARHRHPRAEGARAGAGRVQRLSRAAHPRRSTSSSARCSTCCRPSSPSPPRCSAWPQAASAGCRPTSHPFFRDVSDALVRSVERARNLYNLLATVLEANQTQVSIRQNEDMRKITAWVAIAAVPTMIAGHLRHELRPHARAPNSTVGLSRGAAGMFVICYMMYRRFKQSDWL